MEEQLAKVTQEMQEATAAFREAHSKSETRLKELGSEGGELKERMAKAESALDAAEAKHAELLKERAAEAGRIAEMDKKIQLWERARAERRDKAPGDETLVKSAFIKGIRGGMPDVKGSVIRKWAPTEAEAKAWQEYEEKALSTDSGEAGGYTMPPAVQGPLIEKLIESSPLMELADSVVLTQGDTWEAPREGDTNFECGWVGERSARPETTAGTFAKETITAHEIYAKPLASQKMIDDPGLDVESWLNGRVARRIGVKVNSALIVGDNDGKPEGITANDVAIGSGDFGYVPLGDANDLTADGLIDTYYDLPEFYANQATWLMHRSTIAAARKLKGQDNEYLWAPGFEQTPPTILARPYREAIDMPTVSSNAFAVAFGAWMMAYMTVRRQEIRVLRDPYSSKPYVEFYTTARFGGAVVLNGAYRLGKIATS